MLRPVTNEARAQLATRTAARSAFRPGNQISGQIAVPHRSIRNNFNVQKISNRRIGNLKFSYSDFARQLACKPGSTGAIAPSSESLARQVVKQTNLSSARTVVELGPGTGVFTEQIIKNLSDDALFFAIELNQAFVNATRIRCPSARVYHDAASSLPQWLGKNYCSQADSIVSSLPWTLFNDTEQDEIFKAITESLSPGGEFVSIIYLGARFRSRGRYFINSLQDHFSTVTRTPTVWQNLPPTQIYRCTK